VTNISKAPPMRNLLLVLILFLSHISLSQTFEQEIESVIGEINTVQEKVDTLHNWASKILKTDPDKAKEISLVMLSLTNSGQYDLGKARAHYNIGKIAQYGPFDEAMENLLIAKDLFVKLDDQKGLANTLLSLALVHEGMGSEKESVDAVKQASLIAKSLGDDKILSRCHTNLCAIYHYFNKIDSALYHGKIALGLKKKINDDYGTKLMLLNMGVIMANYDSLLDDGLNYLLEARALSKNAIMINDVEANLVYAYSRKRDWKMAEVYLDSAITGNDTIDNDYTLRGIYKIAVEMYEDRGNYAKAHEYLRKEYNLDKKLRGFEVKERIEVLQLENENAKKEQQILGLEKEKAETNLKYTIAGLLFLFAAMGGVIIFLVMRFRVRSARLKSKQLRLELEHKNRELASYAVNFVQKNEIINNMKEKVNELNKKISPENKKALKEISGIIDESFRADKEWENFKLRFEEVHEGFFSTLQQKCPDLGNAEVKLCALIRLNMNLKESSQILGISPDSVKTARYRIRKKLGLSKDENLANYMAAITA
jgi:DNA-binding CsgD family transcriptional regulator